MLEYCKRHSSSSQKVLVIRESHSKRHMQVDIRCSLHNQSTVITFGDYNLGIVGSDLLYSMDRAGDFFFFFLPGVYSLGVFLFVFFFFVYLQYVC